MEFKDGKVARETQYFGDERGQVIYDPGVTLVETWQALECLVDEGQCKTIGLSNISLERLREIVEAARIKPAVVEVESHPYLPEWDLLEYCQRHGIVLLVFAALGHGMEPRLLDHPVIIAIAQRVRKTPCLSLACLGGTTRHRVPDYLSYARPHPGELRTFGHTGRRHAGNSGRGHDEDPAQYRRGDRRAWVYSQRSVNARPLTRPARFSQATEGAAASRESARGSAGAVTLICMV